MVFFKEMSLRQLKLMFRGMHWWWFQGMTMFTSHKMGPPLCGTGNGRDGDKLLCNRCPLKYEAREWEGWNALREHVQLKARRRKTCTERYNWYLKYMMYIYGMDAAIRNRVCYNPDPRYGRSHPTKIKQVDSGMVAAIQSVSHVHNDKNPQSQPGLQQTQSRVLRSISTRT